MLFYESATSQKRDRVFARTGLSILPLPVEEIDEIYAMQDSYQYQHANPEAIARREARLGEAISLVQSEAQLATPAQMAQALQAALDIQLLAYMVGQSNHNIESWVEAGEDGVIRLEGEPRLVAAYEVLRLFDHFEQPGVLATWIIGRDPQLDYRMPAQLIREGQLEEVLAAAHNFVLVD